ncbi:MAG: serpin family protein [Cyclobacteriaceae bacterium]|nr:serpin family protein [Cyclobacteriaceae bacterium]
MILISTYSKTIKYFALFAAIVMLGACDNEFSEIDESKINKNISAQDRLLIDANNELSISLLRASFENNDTANFFFPRFPRVWRSECSYNGVGETEKETIVHFAGYESLEVMEINKSYNQLLNFLALNGGKLQLTCANSLWFSSDIPINEDYRSTMMAYYDAEVSEINFSKKTSQQSINNWGHLKTNGLISGLIATPPAQNSENCDGKCIRSQHLLDQWQLFQWLGKFQYMEWKRDDYSNSKSR